MIAKVLSIILAPHQKSKVAALRLSLSHKSFHIPQMLKNIRIIMLSTACQVVRNTLMDILQRTKRYMIRYLCYFVYWIHVFASSLYGRTVK